MENVLHIFLIIIFALVCIGVGLASFLLMAAAFIILWPSTRREQTKTMKGG